MCNTQAYMQQRRYLRSLSAALFLPPFCKWTVVAVSVYVLHDPHQGARATPVSNQAISHSCLHADYTVSTATQAVLSEEKCLVRCE